MSNRVVHFEIPADNPEATVEFFSRAFDWKFTRFGIEEYWLATTGDEKQPGINGAVMKKRDPQQPLVNTIAVTDLDEAIRNVESAGGKIVMPIRTIPGVGRFTFFTDPGGIIHGIMQDESKQEK